MRKLSWFAFFLCICSVATVFAQVVHPGVTGAQLENLVRQSHQPTNIGSYSQTKTKMFTTVDNQNGNVPLIYTGDSIATATVPAHTFVNVEHVWPQSQFGNNQANKKKCDLHHLFPCHNSVNSARGNHPFGEINDSDTDKWFAGPTFITGVPGANRDNFSESTSQRFEPREADKGNIARAVFYFRAIYGNSGGNFFESQRATLLQWHQNDPANAAEIARNGRVAAVQGNRNPFIDDPTLAARMFGSQTSGSPPVGPPTPPADGPRVLQDGEEVSLMSWNLRFFYDADKTDNASDLAKEQSADSPAEFTARVGAIAQVIKNAGMPEVIALQEIENRKVVQDLANHLNNVHGGKYKVAFEQGTDTFTEQDVAFLYADRGLSVESKRIPNAQFSNPTLFKIPSKHSVLTINQPLQDGTTQQVVIINCHLKAGGNSSDEAQRKKQARVINEFIKQTLLADPSIGMVVVGDTNAKVKFANTTAQDTVGVLRGLGTLDAIDDLVDLNGNLAANKRVSHVSNKELDRTLISGALLDDVGLVFEQVVIRRDLINSDQSDHFPMVSTFVYRKTEGN